MPWQVACGSGHTCALTDNGSLWTWGDNKYGQLGHGNQQDLGQPTRVTTLQAVDSVTVVACGQEFTAAVLANGQLYTWGLGWNGQLGHDASAVRPGSPEAGHGEAGAGGEGAGNGNKSPTNAKGKGGKRAGEDSGKAESKDNRQDHKMDTSLAKTHRRGHGGNVKEGDEAEMQLYTDKLHFVEAKIACDIGHSKSNSSGPAQSARARSCSWPQQVQALANNFITLVACGGRHMLAHEAQDEAGAYNVYSWGQGSQGQLGHGTAHDEFAPRCIEGARGLPILALVAGPTWSAIFVSEQDAFVYGHLTYGHTAESCPPSTVQVGLSSSIQAAPERFTIICYVSVCMSCFVWQPPRADRP